MYVCMYVCVIVCMYVCLFVRIIIIIIIIIIINIIIISKFNIEGDNCDVNMVLVTSLRKQGNVLFNDALNTFYLRLYGVKHMVNGHSDSERGNPLSPHGYSSRLAARVILYASSHRQDNTYHGL